MASAPGKFVLSKYNYNFYNYQLEIMRFIHSFDNMFLFSNHNVTHMYVAKQYNENRCVRALLTIRKQQINLPPSSNFLPKMVPLTGTVPLTYFMGYSESIPCITQGTERKRMHCYIRSKTDLHTWVVE